MNRRPLRQLGRSESDPPGEPKRYVNAGGYVRLRWKTSEGYVERYERDADGRLTRNREPARLPVDRFEVRRLHAEGLNWEAIAARLGADAATISRIAATMGLPKQRRAAPVDITQLALLYESGMGLVPLARQARISTARARDLLVASGVRINHPGPRPIQRSARKCPTCGTEALPRKKYCSPSCVPAPKRSTKSRSCRQCGKERVIRSDSRVGSLCRSCEIKQRPPARPRSGHDVECETCRKVFYRSPASTKRFCSVTCYTAWRSDQPSLGVLPLRAIKNSGPNNGRYKHGKRVGQHVTKKNVRARVIQRDGDWCLLCGKPPRGLHLHRVVYGSHGGIYEPANCVQLCAVHHEVVHFNKPMWAPQLLDYLATSDERARHSLLVDLRSTLKRVWDDPNLRKAQREAWADLPSVPDH